MSWRRSGFGSGFGFGSVSACFQFSYTHEMSIQDFIFHHRFEEIFSSSQSVFSRFFNHTIFVYVQRIFFLTKNSVLCIMYTFSILFCKILTYLPIICILDYFWREKDEEDEEFQVIMRSEKINRTSLVLSAVLHLKSQELNSVFIKNRKIFTMKVFQAVPCVHNIYLKCVYLYNK